MKKREARIARKNEQLLKANEKSARLIEKLKLPEVRLGENSPTAKAVRSGVNPNSIFKMQMTWNIEFADCDGQWSWGVPRQWTSEAWNKQILPKLKEWSELTWGEIDSFSSESGHKMHHNMDTDIICEEAQLRMIEIERYSDTIFRFRLGGLQRLWGFRSVATFEILWFDPTHKIYPLEKN